MFASTSVSSENYPQLQQDLLPGEAVLWSGQPLTSVIFRPSDWYAIPFSVLWGGFAIFWMYGASGNIQPADHSVLSHNFTHAQFDLFALWGIPFVLIGQYFIWGRFFYTAWKKTRTFYAVTNKRVLVLNAAARRKLTDGFFTGLTSVSVTTRSDGSGTIEFAPEPELSNWMGSNKRNRGLSMDIDLNRLAFFDIRNVRDVYQIIQAERDCASNGANTAYRPR